MTLSSSRTKISYVPDGVQTRFEVPFPVFDEANVQCRTVDDRGEEQEVTGFSVEEPETGNGAFVEFYTPPPAGVPVVIYRRSRRVQESDYPEGGKFPAKVVENDFDRAIAIVQELEEVLSRCLQIDISSGLDPNRVLKDLISFNEKLTDYYGMIRDALGQIGGIASDSIVAIGLEPRKLRDVLGDFVNVKDYGARGDGRRDDAAAFTAADKASGGKGVYVPRGTFYCTRTPRGKYFGPGIVNVRGLIISLDQSIPSQIYSGLEVNPSDPSTLSSPRYYDLIAGQNAGASLDGSKVHANTVFGFEALKSAPTAARATGFGKQVFKNSKYVYSSDAFGADALGQGEGSNRCAALSANALKWAGSKDPVAVDHDFWVPYEAEGAPADKDFITHINLNAPDRWPGIRNYLGPVGFPRRDILPGDPENQVSRSIGIGRNALLHSLRTYGDIAIGINALAHAVHSEFNTAVGIRAMRDTVRGWSNTAIGADAMTFNITGQYNVAIGRRALMHGSHASYNVCIGFEAGLELKGRDVIPTDTPTARYNCFIGYNSGKNATDGRYNVAIGAYSLTQNTSNQNTAIGESALRESQSGDNNVAIGFCALEKSVSGSGNVAAGSYALMSNTAGHNNTAVGKYALSECAESSSNAALGWGALRHLATGRNNAAFGHQSLQFMQNGANASHLINCAAIGFNTRCSNHDQVQLGNQFQTCYAYGAVQNRSDPRDKADIRETVLGLDFVLGLKPVDYIWDIRDDYIETVQSENGEAVTVMHDKDGSRKRSRFHHGFLAPQVKEAAETLGYEFGGYQDHSYNGGNDVTTLGYQEFIAPIVRAIQELHGRMEQIASCDSVMDFHCNPAADNDRIGSAPGADTLLSH